MDESSLLQSLGQVSAGDAAEICRNDLRGCLRGMICDVMAAEVSELCRPKHSPTSGGMFRAGNAPGCAIFGEDIVRPRVRQRQTIVAVGDRAERDLRPWLSRADRRSSDYQGTNPQPRSSISGTASAKSACDEYGRASIRSAAADTEKPSD